MKTKNKQADRMRQAYGVAGRILRERLAQERPEDHSLLEDVRPSEVVIVHGEYDHIHRVLDATEVPYLQVAPETLSGADWASMEVLFVNCPGNLPGSALRKIGPWVRNGGVLVTTDWALKHVLEPVFPGRVRHNGGQTTDCVVRVSREASGEDDLLEGFLEDDREPLWWLEGASYPIEVLDSENVRVLVRSGEIGRQWGQDPVVVTFDEGAGTVLHMLSHLYLQRSDVRDARDSQSAATYLASGLQLDPAMIGKYASQAGDLCASEIGAAMSTSRLLSNVVLSSRRKRERKVK